MWIIVAEFVAAGVEHDIHESDWAQKMVDERARVKIERDPSKCPALAGVGDEEKINWRCIWNRKDKPPQIRKLGSTDAMMEKACLACVKTKVIRAGLKYRDDRIIELEKGLRSRDRELYKIPVCEGGAHLIPDGTGFERCRRSNIAVDVLRFCKVVDNGPCAYFSEIVVGIGEKNE